MKILIIGGMGVIGGAITRAAVQSNNEVYVVSRKKVFGEWNKYEIKEYQGDWKDDSFAKKVMENKFDVVVDTLIFTKQQLIRSLEIVNKNCKHFIYISTDAVYPHPGTNVSEHGDIKESELSWDYGINKRIAEVYLLENKDKYNFDWTVVRPTLTFGDTRLPVGFSTIRESDTLIKRILAERPIIRFDEENSKHAMCHVSTFGEAVVDLFCNDHAYGECFHVSDDTAYTYDEVFSAIEKVLNKKAIYVFIPIRFLKKYSRTKYEEIAYDKNPEFILDNSKIKKLAPEVNYKKDLDMVISNTVKYLSSGNERIREDFEYDYISDLILMEYYKKIKNNDSKNIVETYILNLPNEYKVKLDSFKKKRIIKEKLLPIRRSLGRLKRSILK